MRTIYYIVNDLDDLRSCPPHYAAILKFLDGLVRAGARPVLVMCAQDATQDMTMDELRTLYGIEGLFGIHWTRRPQGIWARQLVANRINCRAVRKLGDGLAYSRYFASAFLGLRGQPVIIEVHQMRYDRRFKSACYKLALSLALRLDRKKRVGLVAISDKLKDWLQTLPLAGREVLTAFSGVDDFTDDPAFVRARAERDGRRPTLLYAGTFDREKGVHHVIELAGRMPEARFVLVGCPEGELDEWRGRCPFDNVEILSRVPPGDMPGLLGRAEYCLLLNDPEHGVLNAGTSPLKLFEYMMAGTVVLASDLPAVREVVSHGVNGVLVDPRDLEAVRRVVLALQADPGTRDALAARGRETALAHTWNARAARVLAFVKSLGM